MTKYHINSKGVPAICKAKKGKCPFNEHFDNENEAQKHVDKAMESEYGFLPKNTRMSTEQKEKLASLIQRVSGTKTAGFDYECYASLSVAEEMGFTEIAVTDENGLTVNLSMGGDGSQVNASVLLDNTVTAISDYYERIGVSIKNKDALARVVYHNKNIEKGALVQSGGPNVLDAAIIKANEVVDIIEIKKLSTGAQLPAKSLSVDRYGNISGKILQKQKPYMREAIKHIKIQDADGTDVKVDFGDEEKNKRFPLQHFVEQYKEKGATSFVYTTEKGSVINKIDLTRDTEEVIDELIEKKIEANVTLRANHGKRNVTEDDIYRFNHILSKEYSKSKRASHSESFTLKSIKPEKISKAGKYVRVGGYVLPIEYEGYENHLNKRINKKDLKAFKLMITGDIKTHY